MNQRTAADLRVRRAGPEDVERILELARASLGTGDIPRERAFWDWKHVLNPFGASPVLIAEADESLVGLRVFMRWHWAIHGSTIRAVRAVDTATHPAWQGRGIFSKLTRALVEETRAEGVDLIFNTPNAKSGPGYLKMGWSAVGRVDLLIRPSRPLRIARHIARRAPAEEGAALGNRLDDGSVAAFLGSPGTAELVEKAADLVPSNRLSTPRSVEYLRWRYSMNPAFRYHVAVEPEDSHSLAVFYRTLRRGALTELRICEIFTGERAAPSISLGRKLVRRLERAVAPDYISAMATPRTPAWFALTGAGFVPVPRLGPNLTVRRLRDDNPSVDPTRRSSWSLSIGDLELF